MPVDVTLMIASVGASMVGSGTVSTRTSCVPCQVRAFMARPLPEALQRGTGPVGSQPPRGAGLRVRVGPRDEDRRHGRHRQCRDQRRARARRGRRDRRDRAPAAGVAGAACALGVGRRGARRPGPALRRRRRGDPPRVADPAEPRRRRARARERRGVAARVRGRGARRRQGARSRLLGRRLLARPEGSSGRRVMAARRRRVPVLRAPQGAGRTRSRRHREPRTRGCVLCACGRG